MKSRNIIAALAIVVLFAQMALADTHDWKYVRGKPRAPKPITSAAAALDWFKTQAQWDIEKVSGSKETVNQVNVRLEQDGVAEMKIKRGGMVSLDNGATWFQGEFRNLTYGQDSARVMISGIINLIWKNVTGGSGYYPKNMTGWVPTLVGACGNMVLVKIPPPKENPPDTTSQTYTPPPAPQPTPTPTPQAAAPQLILTTQVTGPGKRVTINPGGWSVRLRPTQKAPVQTVTNSGNNSNAGNVNTNTNSNTNTNNGGDVNVNNTNTNVNIADAQNTNTTNVVVSQ